MCDLAGTEPAADIKYSVYKRHVWEDGSVEHQYVGDHPDVQLTKTLQEQGKKINLSLSEMAQFFLKMAAKIKNGQLKPGRGWFVGGWWRVGQLLSLSGPDLR